MTIDRFPADVAPLSTYKAERLPFPCLSPDTAGDFYIRAPRYRADIEQLGAQYAAQRVVDRMVLQDLLATQNVLVKPLDNLDDEVRRSPGTVVIPASASREEMRATIQRLPPNSFFVFEQEAIECPKS